jgi:transposase-like protein
MKPRTRYSPDVAQRVLDQLGDGSSLAEVCRRDGMPSESTVRLWVRDNVDGFGDRYHRVRGVDVTVKPFLPCYSLEIADAVIERLTTGQSLAKICRQPGMPSRTTINVWVAMDRDGFAARYRLARQIGHGRVRHVSRTPELEDLILAELMSGRSLTDVCLDPEMPCVGTVHSWRAADPDGFGARYHRAREIGAETLADTVVDIADSRDDDWITCTNPDGTTHLILDPERVNRTRQRIEARCWLLSKIQPRTYGDRIDLTTQSDGGESWADLLKAVDGKTLGLPNKKRDDA